MQNAMAHVPKMAMKAEVAADLRRVFEADDSAKAQRRLQDVVPVAVADLAAAAVVVAPAVAAAVDAAADAASKASPS
jgi:hypothetical protein